METVQQIEESGISIQGQRINNLRFADDVDPVLLSFVLGLELSLRTHLKSLALALKVESLALALKVESLLALI